MGMIFIGRFYTMAGGQMRFFAADDFSSGKLIAVDAATAETSVAFEGSYADAVAQMASQMLAAATEPRPVQAAAPEIAEPVADEGISMADMVAADDAAE